MGELMYNAAIVGCGRISSIFDDDPLRKFVSSHAGAYNTVKKTRLIAAADLDDEKLSNFGKRWGAKSLYRDYKEMLKKEHIDILSICTWNSTHYEILKEAVKAGVKAIFCEKPISDSLKHADEMVRLTREKNIVLAVGHQRRWDKLHNDIRQMIHDKEIGDIQQVTFYYTKGIANTGSHVFDLLRYFFGDVKWVFGVYKRNENSEDPDIDGYMHFNSGVSASIQSCDANNYLIFEVNILGSSGGIRIINSGFDTEFFKVNESKLFSGYKELEKIETPFKIEKKEMLIQAVEDIIRCIETGKDPMCTGEDGRNALEIISAFHESARKGGKKINLPLKNRNLKIKAK
jgi:predicted dehydrogenase